MDKQTFNKLDILEQLKYVNEQLLEGGSLRSISSNLDMSKTTIRDRFLKFGYVFNNEARQYIKDNSITAKVEYKQNTNILKENKSIDNKAILEVEYNHNTNIKGIDSKVVENVEYKHNTSILQSKEKEILEMLEWFNKQKNIIDVEPQELKIDTNKLIGEVKTTTVRLYSDTWEQFKKFMEGYKAYKSMDLVSMALVEYMDKYKK